MKYLRYLWGFLTICCLIYSVSIYMVGSGTFSFVIWIVGAIFFGAAFVLSGHDRWKKLPAVCRKIIISIIAIGVAVFGTCYCAMFLHFNDNGMDNLDYIVVLGAQIRESGPSPVYKFRLDAAADYLVANPDTICIVSGGMGVNEPVSEGKGGKDYLVSRGIEADRIIAETNALDTVQNIEYSMEIIEAANANVDELSIGIVTSNFHLFRGVSIARKATSSRVYGIAAKTLLWYLPNNMTRECFGILRDLRYME